MTHPDSFGARSTLAVGGTTYDVFRLGALQSRYDVARLPYTLRILLENLLRREDGDTVTREDVEAIATWDAAAEPSSEITFAPARVLLQDFTGVPAVVDLAAMRDAMAAFGGDPSLIDPLIPAELVIDHSVQVDDFASRLAIRRNAELEFERNRERYAFLRWGQEAFDALQVVPPNTGICHQVNLEFLARVVEARDGQAFPDTLVGTDSHTTMINGLGVLGWGVGGIEAEAAMLGESISMLVPQVVGFRLHGQLPEGATATDLVLTVTQILRADRRRREVRRVLRRGPRRPAARRPGHDREHVAGVRRDVRLLPGRRRDAPLPAAHGPQRRAGRARRGVLQGEHALARPVGARHLLAGRRARPVDRRAVARRPAAPAGPDPARLGEGVLPRGPGNLRRRLRQRRGRGERRVVPRERRSHPLRARRGGARGGAGGGRRAGRPRSDPHRGDPVRARRRDRPPRSRRGRDRGDHVVHEHLEPVRDGRGGPACEEGRRAGPRPEALGQVEPRARLEGRHATTSTVPASRRTSRRSGSTRSATAARPASGTPARCRSRSRRRSPRAISSPAPCSPATGTSRPGCIRR